MEEEEIVKRLEFYLSKQNLENDYVLKRNSSEWCMFAHFLYHVKSFQLKDYMIFPNFFILSIPKPA